MTLQQVHEFILRIFDGPYDELVDCAISDSETDALILFLKSEGYINFQDGDLSISFTDKGYDILFKLNDGTNVDKLSTFGELKKISEKFYGQRQKMGNIE
jgi:hypothetical protein